LSNEKCQNNSCPYRCQYGFCGIDVEGCSLELLTEREGIIHPSAYVRSDTVIEKDVEIAELACVGSRGMTLRWDTNKHIHWRRKGQDYPVILKEGAYIGARTVIMRGTKWSTVIDENTFIGPNVSIGHDNKIGKHCCILSGTVTCGSVVIGDYSYIAPSCTIRDNITLGKGVTIGIGSLVLKDVPDGATVVGRPAQDIMLFRKERQKIKELIRLE